VRPTVASSHQRASHPTGPCTRTWAAHVTRHWRSSSAVTCHRLQARVTKDGIPAVAS
jgi:hypothetical protein